MSTHLPVVSNTLVERRAPEVRHDVLVGAHGARVALSVSHELSAALLAALAPAVVPSGQQGDGAHRAHGSVCVARCAARAAEAHYRVYVDGRAISCSLARAEALHNAVAQVDALVALHARALIVHAGAVRFGERAVLFPGASFSGKSRLAAALVRAGGELLSDDYAVLDREGRVHAYMRAPSLRAGAIAPRWVWADCASCVGLVVITRHRALASFSPREVSRAAGVQALLVNTPAARSAPTRALPALAVALAKARVWEGERGEAELAASQIRAALETP